MYNFLIRRSLILGVLTTVWSNAALAVSIAVSSAALPPGGTGVVVAVLHSEGASVQGVVNEISFGPAVQLTGCVTNPVFAAASAIAYEPIGCAVGVNCSGIRAVVASLGGIIPDGSQLYACTVLVSVDAPHGSYQLACTNSDASDPLGQPLPTGCIDGSVTVPSNSECIGDKDSSGSVEAPDVVASILCFAQDDITRNSTADGNRNGSCEANEIVQVVDNFARDECDSYRE